MRLSVNETFVNSKKLTVNVLKSPVVKSESLKNKNKNYPSAKIEELKEMSLLRAELLEIKNVIQSNQNPYEKNTLYPHENKCVATRFIFARK